MVLYANELLLFNFVNSIMTNIFGTRVKEENFLASICIFSFGGQIFIENTSAPVCNYTPRHDDIRGPGSTVSFFFKLSVRK
jgi:hypothetical protein